MSKVHKMYLVVDNNGRHGGSVHGIYATEGDALLAAANTAAQVGIYVLTAKKIG